MSEHARTPVVVAITGASGALYAMRTLAALLTAGCRLELVVSDFGRRLLRDELGERASVDRLPAYLGEKYGVSVPDGAVQVYSNKDLGAPIASGSHGSRG
ncbi:MAG TPA: flavoprotein, partial [Vicinamibacterales bacterium]